MVWMLLGKTNLCKGERVLVAVSPSEGHRTNSQFFDFLSYSWYTLAIDFHRIPMVEGSTPFSFTEMDRVLDRIDETTKAGQSVLVHCRGGKFVRCIRRA